MTSRQLAGLFEGFPSLFSTPGHDSYRPLPTSNTSGFDDAASETTLLAPEDASVEENAPGSSRRWNRLYHRSLYYWIAFGALCFQAILEVLAIAVSSRRDSAKDPNTARFIVTAFYSFISLGLSIILLWWQYKKQSDSGPPSKINALAHVILCSGNSSICLITIFFLFIFDNSKRGFNSNDIRWFLVPLMAILLSISTVAMCIAARITYSAAVRARGTQRVPLPTRPPPMVAAWTLATTSESQSLVLEAPPYLKSP